jgi:glycosyltransferase involved in cell wall biosynthesis
VSVVIPTYERPQFLKGAVQTSLGQTYENIEVIVVDDGSSEQYADEVVSEFPDNVTCIQHMENKGLSAARNTGIQESNGEYVAFLDDDDRWHKSKLARQVSALEQNETAGLATCLVAAITPDNELVHCETSAPSGDCSEELLIGNQIGTPSRVLVRQECFNEIGMFDESLPTKQDWDFYLRLCQEWNVAALEDHLCFRTVHDSMSSSVRALKRDKRAVLEKHEDLIRENKAWEQAHASIAEEVGRSHLGKGELDQARNELCQSLAIPTSRRLLLFSLSYTHPKIVNGAIMAKRALARKLSSCEEMYISSTKIPGVTK